MSSIQNHKQNYDHSLSFDSVSKLFPLPLSEAADILGVSTSVLKKLCNENGLERWPHRKYLAGKSIEEIKAEAVKEKNKSAGGNSQGNKQKSSVVSSSPGSNVKDTISRSSPEMSKSQGNAQQQGSKITWRPHQMLASGLPLQASMFSEEFKYGFPSSGLSRSNNKWWGASVSKDGSSKDETQITSDVKNASETQAENRVVHQQSRNESGKVSLSVIRKRALDEGQKALESGVLKKHGADQLRKDEQILLRRLFQAT